MANQSSSSLFAFAVWIGFWILAFTATHIPIPKEPIVTPDYADKVIHFGIYCMLVLLCGRFVMKSNQRLQHSGVWSIALVFTLYGLFDEWSQAYVGRDTNFWDFLANLSGVIVGVIVLNYIVDTNQAENTSSDSHS